MQQISKTAADEMILVRLRDLIGILSQRFVHRRRVEWSYASENDGTRQFTAR